MYNIYLGNYSIYIVLYTQKVHPNSGAKKRLKNKLDFLAVSLIWALTNRTHNSPKKKKRLHEANTVTSEPTQFEWTERDRNYYYYYNLLPLWTEYFHIFHFRLFDLVENVQTVLYFFRSFALIALSRCFGRCHFSFLLSNNHFNHLLLCVCLFVSVGLSFIVSRLSLISDHDYCRINTNKNGLLWVLIQFYWFPTL